MGQKEQLEWLRQQDKPFYMSGEAVPRLTSRCHDCGVCSSDMEGDSRVNAYELLKEHEGHNTSVGAVR
jgi:hypothetical protein